VIWLASAVAAALLGWAFGTGDQSANLRAARTSAPSWGLLILLAATLGGFGRERLRLRRSYASPTRAWLGKTLAAAGLIVLGTFAGTPVDWDPVQVSWAAAGAGLGGALWLANLPRKL
jgi:membrane associated rhomboid family serine protease